MEPQAKIRKRNHQTDEPSASADHIENFIPRCPLITSNILSYLSAKAILNLSRVSTNWFHACREYLHKKELQCCLVLDRVDGLEAFGSLTQVLDAEILGHRHPFNGVHFKFCDPIDDFFKVGTGPYKRPPLVVPDPEPPEDLQCFNFDAGFDSDDEDYNNEHHDYTQDHETFESWMFDKREEARERYQVLAKLDRPLKQIFAKIPTIKYVHMTVDYGKKRGYQADKFKRFIALLPLHQIEYFRTNLRISEFISDLRVGQLSNLKTIHIDGLMNVLPTTLRRLFSICPVLEKWTSPIPGNLIAEFGSKKELIRSIILYNFITPRHFEQIHDAKLSLTTLIANSTTCPIGKGSFNSIIELMQEQSSTLETIQMSELFLKFVINSDTMTPMNNVRKIVIRNCAKGTKVKALITFPNATFVKRLF